MVGYGRGSRPFRGNPRARGCGRTEVPCSREDPDRIASGGGRDNSIIGTYVQNVHRFLLVAGKKQVLKVAG